MKHTLAKWLDFDAKKLKNYQNGRKLSFSIKKRCARSPGCDLLVLLKHPELFIVARFFI